MSVGGLAQYGWAAVLTSTFSRAIRTLFLDCLRLLLKISQNPVYGANQMINTFFSSTAHMAPVPRHLTEDQRQKALWKAVPKKASSFTLMALTLAACGGGGASGTEGSTSDTGGTSNNGDRTGNLLKGPVEGAFVFADYDGDGVWDEGLEPYARTDSNGAYRLENVDTQQSYELIALLDGAVDNSSGSIFSSGFMKAPTDAQVITPFTTIMVEQELSAQQVADVLGLGDLEDFDPLAFNPYGEGVDAATALAVEKTAHKVMAVVQALSAVFEQSGQDADAAFTMAIDVVADEVRSKANGQEKLELGGDQSSVTSLINEAITRANNEALDTEVVEGLKDSIAAAVNNSLAQIEKVTELSVNGEPNPEFQIATIMVAEVKEAIKDNDETKITLKEETVANAKVEEIRNNSAPEIDLTSLQTTISEATDNLVVAVITVTDDEGDDISIIIDGPDADFFEINAKNEIVFKEQPNYEEKTAFSITIVASDGIEEVAKPIYISITDKEPLASLTINVSKLDGLEAKIEADLAAAEQAISGFYGDGESRLIDELYSLIDTFEPSLGDFLVSSTGIVIEKESTGEKVALTFDGFSPGSLEGLIGVVVDFNENNDFSKLEIAGGFKSLSISKEGGVSVELAHTSTGIEWRNLQAAEGAVDTFIIEGTFGNQIADYINILEVAQASRLGDSTETDIIFSAFESLSAQIGFTGISAKVDGDVIFRIGDAGTPDNETLEIFIAGKNGNHEVNLGILGLSEVTAGVIDAAGGLKNLLLIANASGRVDAYANRSYSDPEAAVYMLSTGLDQTVEFYDTSGAVSYAYYDIYGNSEGVFLTDLPDDVAERLVFETLDGKPLSGDEYIFIKGKIENVQDYLGGSDSPLDSLNFVFSYDFASTVIFDAQLGSILSIEGALSGADTALAVAGYIVDGVPVTEISDRQETVALRLVGVEKSDFLQKYQDQGSDISDTLQLYLPAGNNEVLFPLAV
jgi:hypothetical protein